MPFSFDVFPTINDTDLIYGLSPERQGYWNIGPFRSLKIRSTIDAYAITNEELLSISDPERIPYKNREFIQYISRHEKYNSIQLADSVKIGKQWWYEDQSLVVGRKCKAGLG